MNGFKIFTLVAAAALGSAYAFAVSDDTPPSSRDSIFSYSAEAQATFSTGNHTPLWLAANKFGLSSQRPNYGILRAGVFRHMDYKPRFSWSAAVDLATGYDLTSPFVIQQLYGAVRWRCLQLTVGAKEHTEKFVDEKLSSGDLLQSPNARPIPQVRAEMPNYEIVPYTNRWLAVKAHVSFGLFTDSHWQHSWVNMELPGAKRSVHRLYHSKALYIRVGREDKFPLSFEGGLQMAAQFGGSVYKRSFYPPYELELIKMPNGWKHWGKVLIPTGGDQGGGSGLIGEETNVTGNHTGEWSAALKWDDKERNWSARLYYQHFFEDHSMMFFDHTWRDMLLGIELKFPDNPIASKFVYEYLNTRDQSGPIYWDHTSLIPEQVSGRDDYYNHYLDVGSSHWGYGMGNPLLISPIYNADHELYFYHNRIKGHHIGVEGCPSSQLSYRMLLTLWRSWGTYNIPTSNIAHSFSALWELNYHPARLNGWSGTLGIGLDAGALLSPSFGVQVSIKKTGWI